MLVGCEVVAGIDKKDLKPSTPSEGRGEDVAKPSKPGIAVDDGARGPDTGDGRTPLDPPPRGGCVADPVVAPASLGGGALAAPSSAYEGSRGFWGFAWREGEHIRFNALNRANVLQLAADGVLADVVPNDVDVRPAIATTEGRFVAAYTTSKLETALAVIGVPTWTFGAVARSPTLLASDPTRRLAVAPMAIAVARRQIEPDLVAVANNRGTLDFFEIDRGTPIHRYAERPRSNVFGASVASTRDDGGESKLGVALIEDQSFIGGELAVYDEVLARTAYTFTSAELGYVPSLKTGPKWEGAPRYPLVDIAGAAGRFAVAWVGRRVTGRNEIRLSLVDPSSYPDVIETSVSPPSDFDQGEPQISFDGGRLAVVWIEEGSRALATVWFRRFSRDGVPLGRPLRIGGLSPKLLAHPGGGVRITSAAPGVYGVTGVLADGRAGLAVVRCP